MAGPRAVSFLANPKYVAQLAGTRAGAVILDAKSAPAFTRARTGGGQSACNVRARRDVAASGSAAACGRPSLSGGRGRRRHRSVRRDRRAGLRRRGARIGTRCFIGPGTIVERGATIGDDSRLVARVFVGHHVVFGRRCIVQPGAVIGGDGFGYASEKGAWIKVPQIGGVNIGDDVEIGANTTIDRGALGDTVIEEGVKIDNLDHDRAQRAHRCAFGAGRLRGDRRQQRARQTLRARWQGRPRGPHHAVRRRRGAGHLLHLALHRQAGRVFFRAAERGSGNMAAYRRAHQAARRDGQTAACRGETRGLQRRRQGFFRGLTK